MQNLAVGLITQKQYRDILTPLQPNSPNQNTPQGQGGTPLQGNQTQIRKSPSPSIHSDPVGDDFYSLHNLQLWSSRINVTWRREDGQEASPQSVSLENPDKRVLTTMGGGGTHGRDTVHRIAINEIDEIDEIDEIVAGEEIDEIDGKDGTNVFLRNDISPITNLSPPNHISHPSHNPTGTNDTTEIDETVQIEGKDGTEGLYSKDINISPIPQLSSSHHISHPCRSQQVPEHKGEGATHFTPVTQGPGNHQWQQGGHSTPKGVPTNIVSGNPSNHTSFVSTTRGNEHHFNSIQHDRTPPANPFTQGGPHNDYFNPGSHIGDPNHILDPSDQSTESVNHIPKPSSGENPGTMNQIDDPLPPPPSAFGHRGADEVHTCHMMGDGILTLHQQQHTHSCRGGGGAP